MALICLILIFAITTHLYGPERALLVSAIVYALMPYPIRVVRE